MCGVPVFFAHRREACLGQAAFSAPACALVRLRSFPVIGKLLILSCFFKSREMPQSGATVATATRISAAGGRKAAKRQGFNLVCVIPPLQCADSRFAKPRKFPKGNGFTFFSLLRKEPKVAEGPRPSRLPENGSKLHGIIFFVTFLALVPKPVCGATRF